MSSVRHDGGTALFALLVCASVGAGGAAVDAGPVPVPVRASPTVAESQPAAEGPWLAWGQQENYFVQRGDRRPIRVNAPSTITSGEVYGLVHGAGIDRHVLVYAQARVGGNSLQFDIWRFNLTTYRRTRLPAAVNTAADETRPTLSRGHLLFERVRETGQDGHDLTYSVVLYRIRTGTVRVLDRSVLPYGEFFYPRLSVGQVNGRYAVWDRRRMVGLANGSELTYSRVVRYDLRTGTRTQITGRHGIRLSDPAVSADGTVYYVRTTLKPGGIVDIVRRPLRGQLKVIATLPRGQSAVELYVDDKPSGAHALYYTATAKGTDTNVYKILDPASRRACH